MSEKWYMVCDQAVAPELWPWYFHHRAEKNAIKDEHAHVGEVYIFGKYICFDLKVFAFHKQLVIECP